MDELYEYAFLFLCFRIHNFYAQESAWGEENEYYNDRPDAMPPSPPPPIPPLPNYRGHATTVITVDYRIVYRIIE